MTYTIEPTAELATHHDIIASRRGVPAMIKSRVAALRESGAIDDSEYAACLRFHRDWDIGMEGASTGGLRVRVDADNGGSALDRRIDAMTRVRNVRDRLLVCEWVLLVACIPNDMPWSHIGDVIGVTDKTARTRVIAAVKELTRAYGKIDARGKK